MLKRPKFPNGYWNSPANQRQFLLDVFKKLGFQKWEDWYQVSVNDLVSHGGQSLILRHGGSPSIALKAVFPEHPWKAWKFHQIPKNFWKDASNRREFLDDIQKTKRWSSYESFYQLTYDDVVSNGGLGLLSHYDDSMIRMLSGVYPEHNWREWNFNPVESGFWKKPENQKKFMSALAEHKGFKDWSDWFTVKTPDVVEFGGRGLLTAYGGSMQKILSGVFPEHEWAVWDTAAKVKEKVWTDEANQRTFLESLAKKLNFRKPEDWYNLQREQITKNGGAGLLKFFDYSIPRMITSVFPELKLKIWHFELVPNSYWHDERNIRAFFEDLGRVLHIQKWEDWYQIKFQDVVNHGGRGLLQSFGSSVALALQKAFPEHQWKDESEWSWNMGKTTKSQMQLFRLVTELFSKDAVHMEMSLKELLPFVDQVPENLKLRADVVVPSKLLIFEYQGQQHYRSKHFFPGFEGLQERDLEKKRWCKDFGVTLIEIPYWWNGSRDSLVATICAIRPDLSSFLKVNDPNAAPIPSKDPGLFSKKPRSKLSLSAALS